MQKFYPSPFLYQRIVTSGILAMEFEEHLSSDKEGECFGGRSQVYTGIPPVRRFINIMRVL